MSATIGVTVTEKDYPDGFSPAHCAYQNGSDEETAVLVRVTRFSPGADGAPVGVDTALARTGGTGTREPVAGIGDGAIFVPGIKNVMNDEFFAARKTGDSVTVLYVQLSQRSGADPKRKATALATLAVQKL